MIGEIVIEVDHDLMMIDVVVVAVTAMVIDLVRHVVVDHLIQENATARIDVAL